MSVEQPGSLCLGTMAGVTQFSLMPGIRASASRLFLLSRKRGAISFTRQDAERWLYLYAARLDCNMVCSYY